MTHFAVIAPPLRGHYAPLSALAAELIGRGHRVTFVHQEDARPLVQAEGAGFEAIGAQEPPLDRWTGPMARIRGVLGLGDTLARMKRFTTLFCEEGPAVLRSLGVDAVLADQLEPAGGLLAEHLSLPWISVANTLPMNREPGIPPPFVGWRYDPTEQGIKRNAGGWKVSDLLMRSFNQVIESNAQKLGLPPRRRIEDCFSPMLQLSQLTPGLDFPRVELPSNFHYTGPFRAREASNFALPPGDGRLTVYASLGTLQGSRVGLFRKIAAACDRLGLRLVLTHGGLAKGMRRLPGDPLVYDWLPQEAALAQCDLVVCHAGLNSMLDSVAAGLPMVVMPLAFDQPAIAARVAHSGAGIAISPRSSRHSLERAIATIRDEPSFGESARALREDIRRAGGVARAADLIEAALDALVRGEAATRARAAPDGARDGTRSGSR